MDNSYHSEGVRRRGDNGNTLYFGCGFMGIDTCDNSDNFLFQMGAVYHMQMNLKQRFEGGGKHETVGVDGAGV